MKIEQNEVVESQTKSNFLPCNQLISTYKAFKGEMLVNGIYVLIACLCLFSDFPLFSDLFLRVCLKLCELSVSLM